MTLPNSMSLDRMGIELLPVKEEEKKWLRRLVDDIEKSYINIKGQAESGGLGTKNWEVRDATARDVTDGNAVAVGNLITKHRVNGTKREAEA